mmetsp:Transcript_12445/g.29321  ORF Transcript_12445/g.29321 Transcript_12445/m.29321 type:complete len:114 (+) Transcript_12445:112-453(+)
MVPPFVVIEDSAGSFCMELQIIWRLARSRCSCGAGEPPMDWRILAKEAFRFDMEARMAQWAAKRQQQLVPRRQLEGFARHLGPPFVPIVLDWMLLVRRGMLQRASLTFKGRGL